MPGGQLPTVREDLGIELPAHLGHRYRVRGSGGLVDEPPGDDLPLFPATVTEHAIGNSRKVPRRHAHAMRGKVFESRTSVTVVEPPVLDAQRLEQRFDGELI